MEKEEAAIVAKGGKSYLPDMAEEMTKAKIFELVSVFGVGIISFGLGALFAGYVEQYAYLIILAGILVHGLAMYKIHSQNKEERSWVKFLYRLCWIMLAGLAIYVVVGLLR